MIEGREDGDEGGEVRGRLRGMKGGRESLRGMEGWKLWLEMAGL